MGGIVGTHGLHACILINASLLFYAYCAVLICVMLHKAEVCCGTLDPAMGVLQLHNQLLAMKDFAERCAVLNDHTTACLHDISRFTVHAVLTAL